MKTEEWMNRVVWKTFVSVANEREAGKYRGDAYESRIDIHKSHLEIHILYDDKQFMFGSTVCINE